MGRTKSSKVRSFRWLTLTFRVSAGGHKTASEFRLRFLTPMRPRNSPCGSELAPSSFLGNLSASKDRCVRPVL